MKLMEFKPATEFVSLRDAVDKLMEDSFIRPFDGWALGTPLPIDLVETKDAYLLKAALPGIRPDDITIQATSTEVMLKGEVEEKLSTPESDYLRRELRYGKFQRSITLPLAIDPNKVEATFEHGIVTVTLPKTDVAKPKTITLKKA